MKHKRNFTFLFALALTSTLAGYLIDQGFDAIYGLPFLIDFCSIALGLSFLFSLIYLIFWALFMTYRKSESETLNDSID